MGNEVPSSLETKTRSILSTYKKVSEDVNLAENCIVIALENCQIFEKVYTDISNMLDKIENMESMTVNLSDFNKKKLKILLDEAIEIKEMISSKEENLSELCSTSDVVIEMNSSESALPLVNRVNELCDRYANCQTKISENCSKLEDMWKFVLAFEEDANGIKTWLEEVAAKVSTLNLENIIVDEIQNKDNQSAVSILLDR